MPIFSISLRPTQVAQVDSVRIFGPWISFIASLYRLVFSRQPQCLAGPPDIGSLAFASPSQPRVICLSEDDLGAVLRMNIEDKSGAFLRLCFLQAEMQELEAEVAAGRRSMTELSQRLQHERDRCKSLEEELDDLRGHLREAESVKGAHAASAQQLRFQLQTAQVRPGSMRNAHTPL